METSILNEIDTENEMSWSEESTNYLECWRYGLGEVLATLDKGFFGPFQRDVTFQMRNIVRGEALVEMVIFPNSLNSNRGRYFDGV